MIVTGSNGFAWLQGQKIRYRTRNNDALANPSGSFTGWVDATVLRDSPTSTPALPPPHTYFYYFDIPLPTNGNYTIEAYAVGPQSEGTAVSVNVIAH
jgi:hypothetical protein